MMYQLLLHAVKGLLLSCSCRSSPNDVPTTASRCQRFVIELYLQLGAPPNGVPTTASQRQRFVIELEQPKLHLMMYQLLLLAVKGLLLSYSCRSSP